MTSLVEFREILFDYWTGKVPESEINELWGKIGFNFKHYLMSKEPFMTDTCADCSHHTFGFYEGGELKLDRGDDDGETHVCLE